MPDVLTMGETMALLTASAIGPMRHARSLDLGIAGSESNMAIAAARLGMAAHWVGRVGDDEFGALISTTLRGEGAGVSAIVDDLAPTGLMFKERRAADTTRVRYYRSGSAGSRLCADDLDASLVSSARVVHLSGITAALSDSARAAVFECIQLARSAGVLVSLDLNYRSALWPADVAGPVLADLARRADILFATEDEASLVVGGDAARVADALAALGPGQVLVKRGAAGAVALIQGKAHEVRPEPVRAVDPVGAGDAFAAGYLYGVCSGLPVTARLRMAARLGAFAVTVSGDWEGAPTLAELKRFGDGTEAVDAVHR